LQLLYAGYSMGKIRLGYHVIARSLTLSHLLALWESKARCYYYC